MNSDANNQHAGNTFPDNDSETGAAWGGLGGAVVGSTAGSLIGPVGSVVGAVVGGLAGAGVSGAVVGAIEHQHEAAVPTVEASGAVGADDDDDVAAEADVVDARYNAHHSLEDAVYGALHGRGATDADDAESEGDAGAGNAGGGSVTNAVAGEPGRDPVLPGSGSETTLDPLSPSGATRDRNETEPERIDNTTY